MYKGDKWIFQQHIGFVLLQTNPIRCNAKWILKKSHLAQFPCVLKRTFHDIFYALVVLVSAIMGMKSNKISLFCTFANVE